MNAAAAVNQSTTNTNKQQKQTAKEVIAANIGSLIEQLEQGHSEALTAYFTAMGRFHNYSFGNILETARQKPDASRVAGLYAWNQLGRKVKKGEHGIRILAPVIGVRRKKDGKARRTFAPRATNCHIGRSATASQDTTGENQDDEGANRQMEEERSEIVAKRLGGVSHPRFRFCDHCPLVNSDGQQGIDRNTAPKRRTRRVCLKNFSAREDGSAPNETAEIEPITWVGASCTRH